jgi:hypothetical protein
MSDNLLQLLDWYTLLSAQQADPGPPSFFDLLTRIAVVISSEEIGAKFALSRVHISVLSKLIQGLLRSLISSTEHESQLWFLQRKFLRKICAVQGAQIQY